MHTVWTGQPCMHILFFLDWDCRRIDAAPPPPSLLQRATEAAALLSLLEQGALKEAVALWLQQQQQQLGHHAPARPAAATAVNADASCAAGLVVASIPAQLTTPAMPSPSIPPATSAPIPPVAAAGDPAAAVAHTLLERQLLHTEPELMSAAAGHITHRQKLSQKEERAARRVYVSYLAPYLVSEWMGNECREASREVLNDACSTC